MMPHIDPWLMSILEASLKGSVVLVVALLATRLLRRASAGARHSVLAIGLSALLVLPAASILAPRWTLPIPDVPLPAFLAGRSMDRPAATSIRVEPGQLGAPRQAQTRIRAAPGTLRRTPSGTVTATTPAATTIAGAATRPARPVALPPVDVASPGATAPTSSSAARLPIDWSRALLFIWLAGSLVVVLRLVLGLGQLWMLARRSTMVTDGAWLQAAHATARRLGLTHGVTLLRGEYMGAPMTWGVLRPVVWLPTAASAWAPELRAAVLSHELAHVKRRDAVTQWLANIAIAIHWFNPVVWMAARALRVEREHACDDAVLALGARADEYAGQLLEMVRELGTMSGGPAPALAMARRSQLEGRLLAILDRATERGPVPSTGVLAVATFALVFVGVLAGARVGRGAIPGDDRAAFTELATALARVEARATVAAVGTTGSTPTVARGRIPSATSSRTPLPSPGSAATTRSCSAPRSRCPRGSTGPSHGPAMAAGAPVVEGGMIVGGDDWRRIRETLVGEAAIGAGPMRVTGPSGLSPFPPNTIEPLPTPVEQALLEAVAKQGALADSALLLEIIAATDGISSSEHRLGILERIATRPGLDSTVVTALARSAGKLTSSSKVKLLRTIVQKQPHARGASRTAVLTAINSISSTSEQGSLLELFFGAGELDSLALIDGLRATEKMSGNTAKASVLVAAAKAHRIQGPARQQYLRAARTISMNGERIRALNALLAEPGEPRR